MPDAAAFFARDPRTGLAPAHGLCAYLGASAVQTVGDNPITAYRQLVQQYAKGARGELVAPEAAAAQAQQVFRRAPLQASLSGLGPRLFGVLLKRVPKFGTLWAYTFATGDANPGYGAAVAASVASAPLINPVRMIEKQQRARLRETGREVPVGAILRDARADNFRPLLRGTVPLVGHSLVSALLGLVGQPRLQKRIQERAGATGMLGQSASNLLASAVVSPIYVVLTNPLSRLEVIMQTAAVRGAPVSALDAAREVARDARAHGARGLLRGQGVGIGKAIVSLALFHEARLWLTARLAAKPAA